MITKNNLYSVVKQITPPILFDSFKKSGIYGRVKRVFGKVLTSDGAKVNWNEIEGGYLKGRKLFIDKDGVWKDMLTSKYDDFFFEYLQTLDLKGKVVFDVGAHIGYSSLGFAQAVGLGGKVYAFEPNNVNRERFEKILSENKELEKVINIHNVGIADKDGEEEFVFSDNVDNGTSSGSFLDESDTFWEKSVYERETGFQRTKVKVVTIDSLSKVGINEKPALIKIDIEGAESLALEGAQKTLAEYKPTLLIEIHSIYNMYKCYDILAKLGYTIELLHRENDGRCFIAATVKK